MSLLTERDWRTSYRHEDGDLIELFYNPALACAVQYDRMTGHFSADAPALAALPRLTFRRLRFLMIADRLIKPARYYWLLLSESHLTRRLFGSMVQRGPSGAPALPLPAG